MYAGRVGAGSRIAAALAGAALLAAAPASAAPAPVGEPYGLIAAAGHFVPGRTVDERAAGYRRLYDAGVRAIRIDLNWANVEPKGPPLHDYDFAERDHEVEAITRAGLKVIGILDYGHPDYSLLGGLIDRTPIGAGIPPFYLLRSEYFRLTTRAEFARYARTVAAHYGDEVIAWEVWNEQNLGWRFWPLYESPARYARLLCAAHDAVADVDPGTPVLFGGVFVSAIPPGLPHTAGPDYLEQAYRARPELGRCFDALAYDPYAYPFTSPEVEIPVVRGAASPLAAREAMAAVLRRHGDGAKPLWITEVGWPTHPSYGVTETKQAQYVARMSAATYAEGVAVIGWYTYGDYADPTRGFNQEAWFGFFRRMAPRSPRTPRCERSRMCSAAPRSCATAPPSSGFRAGRRCSAGAGSRSRRAAGRARHRAVARERVLPRGLGAAAIRRPAHRGDASGECARERTGRERHRSPRQQHGARRRRRPGRAHDRPRPAVPDRPALIVVVGVGLVGAVAAAAPALDLDVIVVRDPLARKIGRVRVGRAARDRVALVVVRVVDLLAADGDRAVLVVADVGRAELRGRRLVVGGVVLGAAERLVLGRAVGPVLEILRRVLLELLDLLLRLFLVFLSFRLVGHW